MSPIRADKVTKSFVDCRGYVIRCQQRNSHFAPLEYLRLEKSKTASNYYGPVFYNSLSNEITALARNKFITQIITLLTEGAYYDYRSFYVRCCAK
jgi:hypothetical protein